MRLLAILLVCVSSAAYAAGDAKYPIQIKWPFDGVMGSFDRPSVQRGLQVYKEVCAACHGIKRVTFRTLTDVGFSEAEVKALAAEYTYMDGPNDDGEMFERPGKPFDAFPQPYDNEKQARLINNGAYPPDLSLITKARKDGANYLYSLLVGYQEPPADKEMGDGMYYNPYFPGGQIAMPPQLMEGLVEYQDGTAASVDQMARDIVNFLQWAAEPEMEDRKRMGIRVMIFVFIMTVLFYISMKRIWSDVKK